MVPILLPKRQQPTRPLSRARHINIFVQRPRVATSVQLCKRYRSGRHGVRRIPPPRRGRRLGQVEEDLPVHVALLVARHGLRPVLGELFHLDVVCALVALALGGDGGDDGVDEVDAEGGAGGGLRLA